MLHSRSMSNTQKVTFKEQNVIIDQHQISYTQLIYYILCHIHIK